jgi:AraC-like DNA-binding protein
LASTTSPKSAGYRGSIFREHLRKRRALSISSYLRGRRLSQAAQVLAQGAPNILTVALDVGYGSHEAFTRAFRDFFGVTPEEVRAQRDIGNLKLMEPFIMKDQPATRLPEPVFRAEGPFLTSWRGDALAMLARPVASEIEHVNAIITAAFVMTGFLRAIFVIPYGHQQEMRTAS